MFWKMSKSGTSGRRYEIATVVLLVIGLTHTYWEDYFLAFSRSDEAYVQASDTTIALSLILRRCMLGYLHESSSLDLISSCV